MSKNKLDPAVKAFFVENGRKAGNALMAKHGPEYFKRISAMRKTHGRQRKPETTFDTEQHQGYPYVFNP